MKPQPNYKRDPIASLKLDILKQRELAVRLCRERNPKAAQTARAKLLALENRLEILEEVLKPQLLNVGDAPDEVVARPAQTRSGSNDFCSGV
jgi:hypothetical protein